MTICPAMVPVSVDDCPDRTAAERLDEIASDLVEHFVGRGFRGKAMYVAIDKATGDEGTRPAQGQ